MVQPMLGHMNGDRGQLGDLVAGRLAERATLGRSEAVAAPAALRPVVDDLIHRLDRGQMAPMAFMARLAAPFVTGRPGLLARGCLRRILAGW
jgi:hypothetical protein